LSGEFKIHSASSSRSWRELSDRLPQRLDISLDDRHCFSNILLMAEQSSRIGTRRHRY
jgi:hypothetical protein